MMFDTMAMITMLTPATTAAYSPGTIRPNRLSRAPLSVMP